ncbi:unnamed protein product [Acidocella sp. C78]|nr:hypothetical protein [Acidocella sp. C78]CAG4914014.1 unnamed protein product [Acidocella sp. C78]
MAASFHPSGSCGRGVVGIDVGVGIRIEPHALPRGEGGGAGAGGRIAG